MACGNLDEVAFWEQVGKVAEPNGHPLAALTVTAALTAAAVWAWPRFVRHTPAPSAPANRAAARRNRKAARR